MHILDVFITKEVVKDSLHRSVSPDRNRHKLDKNIRKFLRPLRVQRSKQRIQHRLHLLHSKRKKPHPAPSLRRDLSDSRGLCHDCHSNFLAVFVFGVVLEKGEKV